MSPEYVLALIWSSIASLGLNGLILAALIAITAISVVGFIISRLNRS